MNCANNDHKKDDSVLFADTFLLVQVSLNKSPKVAIRKSRYFFVFQDSEVVCSIHNVWQTSTLNYLASQGRSMVFLRICHWQFYYLNIDSNQHFHVEHLNPF